MNSLSHIQEPSGQTLRNSSASRDDGNASSNLLLLDLLADYILDSDEENAIRLLESLDPSALRDLEHYRVGDRDDARGDHAGDSDVSLLQLASAYSVSTELISLMALKCPVLLTAKREYPYEGQTALHTLVSKENVRAVDAILKQQRCPSQVERLLKLSTVTDKTSAVNATVMLGGLPLSIAALTYNLDMVDMLLKHGAELSDTNDRGDTVFHSLVRFSSLYPEKESKTEELMWGLHGRLKEKHEPRSVWLTENHDGLTVLKLAAQCTQPLLFNFILTLKGVYCDLDEHDGLFDSLLYDITDIDPIAIQLVSQTRGSVKKRNKVAAVKAPPGQPPNPAGSKAPAPASEAEASILEIIYQMEKPDDAFKILDNYVVSRVIRDKWSKVEPLFIAWTLLHFAMMIWITVYAVFKARVTGYNPPPLLNATLLSSSSSSSSSATAAPAINPTTSREVDATGKQFVYVTAFLTALWSVSLLVYEVVRLFHGRSLKAYLVALFFHHNGFYRLQLIVFALSLLVDAIVLAAWCWADGEANNYFLIVALLVGWWFMTFFLRPWKKFSYFTVMLQEVLIGDMLRFSTIFIPELVAFSVAMHITYLPMPGPMPLEFETVGTTLMTMFKLMLGLSDVDVLYLAPQQWLAILLFVLYVLLTYSLMLNALIALMSNTCSIVSQNREDQWKLQRLSIVLFLQESLWIFSRLHSTGQPKDIKIEDLQKKKTTTRTRFVMKISSVRGGTGGAALQSAVKNMMETEEADDADEFPVTATSSDMYDLLAALNFQRKQNHRKPAQEQRASPVERQGEDDEEDTLADVAETVNATYVGIRQTLQRMSRNPFGWPRPSSETSASGPGPLAGRPNNAEDVTDGGDKTRPTGERTGQPEAVQHRECQTDESVFGGGILPSSARTSQRKFVPEIFEIQPSAAKPTEPTVPPLPIGTQVIHAMAKGRQPVRAEKRDKFRRRPDGAELEKFRKRRDRLTKSLHSPRGLKTGGSSSSTSPRSASTPVGHGTIEVDVSSVHAHTEMQE